MKTKKLFTILWVAGFLLVITGTLQMAHKRNSGYLVLAAGCVCTVAALLVWQGEKNKKLE